MTATRAAILERVASYYTECVREHGETARGVDWNSEASQDLRFRELLRVVPESVTEYSILDYGCGYGALVDTLAERGAAFTYSGYDLSEEMIARARLRYGSAGHTFGTDLAALGVADYALASGVLNVKLDVPLDAWRDHVTAILKDLDRLSRRGFAFNALTSYSDEHRKVEQLYYADPTECFDYCKRTFSPHVALLHDYGLWEFTVLVRKGAG